MWVLCSRAHAATTAARSPREADADAHHGHVPPAPSIQPARRPSWRRAGGDQVGAVPRLAHRADPMPSSTSATIAATASDTASPQQPGCRRLPSRAPARASQRGRRRRPPSSGRRQVRTSARSKVPRARERLARRRRPASAAAPLPRPPHGPRGGFHCSRQRRRAAAPTQRAMSGATVASATSARPQNSSTVRLRGARRGSTASAELLVVVDVVCRSSSS